jgi:hypothetical protein
MNNSELEKKLKAAREPAPDKGYQESFPQMVLENLRLAPQKIIQIKHPWRFRLAWGFATVVCVLIAFAAGHWHSRMETDKDILTNSKLIDQTFAMFPNRVRAIVQDEHGINLILSDQENVTASTPIYVRICDGKHCSSLVTFSGQEIQIAGQKVTVLSEAGGGIILEGNRFLWANGEEVYAGVKLKIEAKNLSLVAM